MKNRIILPKITGKSPRTSEQLKELFQVNGWTFTEWATQNNYRRHQVYLVVNGQQKGHRGKSHEIAKKLGLKA